MSTEKPRFSVTFTEDSFEKIQKYKEENSISTQSKAVARLVELAIGELESAGKTKGASQVFKSEPDELSAHERANIKKYRLLDPYGKEAVDGVLDVESRRCEADRQAARAAALREGRQQMETGEMLEPEKVIRFRVPEYTMPMSAGTGAESMQEFPQDRELSIAPPRGTSYIAHVSGDSMEPTYHNGDMVFVHACEEIPVGRIGVFLMDGKQWIKERGDDALLSHNPAYGPRPMTDDIRCQGLVLGVCDESYFE